MMVQDISEFSCYNRTCLSNLTIEFEDAFSLINKKMAQLELNINYSSGVTDYIFIFCKNCNHLLEFKIKPTRFKITIIGCGIITNNKHLQYTRRA